MLRCQGFSRKEILEERLDNICLGAVDGEFFEVQTLSTFQVGALSLKYPLERARVGPTAPRRRRHAPGATSELRVRAFTIGNG